MNALCGLCIQAFSMSILRSLWSLLTEVATGSFLRNAVQVEATPGYKIEDHLGCSTSKSKSRMKMTKRFLEKQLSVIRAGNLIGIFPISHENDTLTVDGKSWQGIYRFVLAAFSAFSMTGKVICCPWYFIWWKTQGHGKNKWVSRNLGAGFHKFISICLFGKNEKVTILRTDSQEKASNLSDFCIISDSSDS